MWFLFHISKHSSFCVISVYFHTTFRVSPCTRKTNYLAMRVVNLPYIHLKKNAEFIRRNIGIANNFNYMHW